MHIVSIELEDSTAPVGKPSLEMDFLVHVSYIIIMTSKGVQPKTVSFFFIGVDECSSRCQHTCISVGHSAVCGCHPGFYLLPNLLDCAGILTMIMADSYTH